MDWHSFGFLTLPGIEKSKYTDYLSWKSDWLVADSLLVEKCLPAPTYSSSCSCLPRHLLLFQREIPRLLFKLLTFLMAQSRQRCYRPQLHSWLRILYKGGAVLNSHSTEKKRKRTNTESLTPTVATIWTHSYCSIRCESPIYLILLITLTLAFSSTHNRRMS